MGVEESSVVGYSVGTIVWVRRRNGSWWPGRIIGSDELSASHLMSPRSGTPVKLLGRDDASVDWYNLEKSKRVKAFRCGEFDACIERAEASLGIPIKKREKYARREDAILHALELEKQQLEMKHRSLGTSYNGSSNINSGSQRQELHGFSSDIYMVEDEPRVHSKFANHKSQMLPRKVPLSGEKESKGDMSYAYKVKTSKRTGWEDYTNESVPHMRGLQDFGLRIAPPKKKFSQSVTLEVSCKPADVHVDSLSNVECMLGDVSHTGTSKSSLAIKRKRSQGANSEDSLVKKRDRRRPLVQVLQSSAKLPASQSFQSENDSGDISMQEEKGYMGVTSRAKSSSCVYLPADSSDYPDNNGYTCEEMPFTATHVGTVPLAEEFSSAELAEETETDSSETYSLEPDMEEDGNLTDTTQMQVPLSENKASPVIKLSENFGDPTSNDIPLLSYMMDSSADARVSNWHMKGKRNIRNLAKRPFDLMDGNGSIKGSSFKMRRMWSSGNNQLMGYYNSGRYPFGLEGNNDSDDDSPSSHMPRRPYWDESDECLDLDDEMGPMLIDVDIQVQKRSYQGEHVPWVSLSSKWNGGKPILGHPIQIEILEDGSTRHLVSKYDLGLDEIYGALPAFTRTAKRSVMHRIPRSMDDAESPFDPDQEIKPPHNRAYNGYSKKGNHLKRVSTSTKKMRTLSSFATDKRLSKMNGIFDGLINPVGGIPLVTCVPVKVVFSRILESVGRSRGLL